MIAPEKLLLDVANRKKLGVDIVDAVLGGELEGGIDAAPALSLVLADPGGRLVGSRQLVRNAIRTLGEPEAKTLRPIDLRVGEDVFRLVKASYSDEAEQTTLLFEPRGVAYMRQHDKPLVVSRGKITRAQMVRREVEEVGRIRRGPKAKVQPINFWAPGVRTKQPLAPLTSSDRRQLRPDAEPGRDVTQRSRTVRNARGVTVKGKPATPEQRRNMAIALEEAGRLRAGPKATLALFCACTQESDFLNLTHGHSSSTGILQLLASTASNLGVSARDVRACVRLFLQRGFWRHSPKGAIELAKLNPGWSAGKLAQECQGSAHPERYDPHREESRKNIAALGGDELADDTGGEDGGAYFKRYSFTREAGKDAWTHTGELADEVSARRFWGDPLELPNTIIYAPEEALYRLPARARLSPDHSAVVGLDYDLDRGKTAQEVQLTVVGADWRIPWGQPIVLRDAGPVTGKWLVANVARGLWEHEARVTLRQPHDLQPEPRAELAQRADPTDASSSSSSSSSSSGAGGLRARIIEEAEKTLTSRSGFRRYTQIGASNLTNPMPASGRSDCSQWVAAIYHKAGAGFPGGNTREQAAKGRRTSSPRPADLMLTSGHVELYVGNGRTIGHGTNPIDYATPSAFPGHFFVTFDFLDS